jgi:hypothetical protein
VSTARRWYAQAVSPYHAFGRTLLRLRKEVQALPLRFSRHEVEFLDLCDLVVPRYSMVDLGRLQELHYLATDVARRDIRGAIVETGCWNGGSAAMMAAAAPSRDVWLFDSFEGLPQPTADDPQEVHDLYFKGWCAGDQDLAGEILRKVGVADPFIHIVKGWYEDTLPAADPGPIALLHIDSDWYESVKLCLESLYSFVVPGGIIVFDDYDRWSGCKKAVDEFLTGRDRLRDGRYLVKGVDRERHTRSGSPSSPERRIK